MTTLTAEQIAGLTAYVRETHGLERFVYIAEKDDDHDEHVFVRVFKVLTDGGGEVADVIVERDGRIEHG